MSVLMGPLATAGHGLGIQDLEHLVHGFDGMLGDFLVRAVPHEERLKRLADHPLPVAHLSERDRTDLRVLVGLGLLGSQSLGFGHVLWVAHAFLLPSSKGNSRSTASIAASAVFQRLACFRFDVRRLNVSGCSSSGAYAVQPRCLGLAGFAQYQSFE